MSSKRVLIVGGVAGGASCAARLRRMDEEAEICLLERGPDVSFANCGLPYYVGGVIADRRKLLVATPGQFRDMFNVEVRTRTEVVKIDRPNRRVEVHDLATGTTTTEPYDTLVLSPGATPIRPPVPGVDLPGIYSLRNLADVDRIHARITSHRATRAVVVGAGFIGLEMVENLVRRGLKVTVLELTDQVMPPVDPEMTTPVLNELRAKGVDVQLANGLAGFEQGPSESLIAIGADGRRATADLVILAVGVRPDVSLAKEAGLEIGPTGGIRVDDQMRTSDPNILAVGDAVEVRDFVTGKPALVPLAGPANRQGRIAADVIAGRDARFRGVQGTAVVGVFDLTLAMTGATEKTLRRAEIPYRKMITHPFSHASYYPGAHMMALKVLFDPDDGRLLGAQAVGKVGVEKRIDVLAMALQKGATVYDLEEAELCYAPAYGSAKDPVNMVGFAAGNVLRGDVEPVFWDQWKRLQAEGGPMPMVIDVRPPKAVAKAAVPGTLNIPLSKLRSQLDTLPRDREIWIHCGVGKTSYYAGRILKQKGFDVRNLAGGIVSFKMEPPSG